MRTDFAPSILNANLDEAVCVRCTGPMVEQGDVVMLLVSSRQTTDNRGPAGSSIQLPSGSRIIDYSRHVSKCDRRPKPGPSRQYGPGTTPDPGPTCFTTLQRRHPRCTSRASRSARRRPRPDWDLPFVPRPAQARWSVRSVRRIGRVQAEPRSGLISRRTCSRFSRRRRRRGA